MDDNANPYLEQMQGHDTHEQDLQRSRRDRGLFALGLFLLLAGSLAGNGYQLHAVKEIHHIVAIDDHGRPVSTLLRPTWEIPQDDPLKQLIIRRYVEEWVDHLRTRTLDTQFLAINLNTAQRQIANEAVGKFETAYTLENPFVRVKKERVEVKPKGQPISLTPTIWQAEWKEEVTDQHGTPVRTDLFQGRFQLAENPKAATPMNPFGLTITDFGIDQLSE